MAAQPRQPAHGEQRTPQVPATTLTPPAGLQLAGTNGDLDPASRHRDRPRTRQPAACLRADVAGGGTGAVVRLQRLRPFASGLPDSVRLELVAGLPSG